MSRNHKLREVADKLPPMYDHKKYDTEGKSVRVDHFRQMLDLRNKIRSKYPRHPNKLQRDMMHFEELQIAGTYSQTVLEEYRKLKLKRIAKIVQYSVSILSCIGLAIYLWIKYF